MRSDLLSLVACGCLTETERECLPAGNHSKWRTLVRLLTRVTDRATRFSASCQVCARGRSRIAADGRPHLTARNNTKASESYVDPFARRRWRRDVQHPSSDRVEQLRTSGGIDF